MPKNKDVFPPYNLPDEAVPWGREAQKRIIAGENSEVQLTQKVDNGLRATAGQLSALADQILDLSERQTLANTLSDSLEVVGNLSGDARNFWSPFEFSITRPRGIVLSTDMTASISAMGTGGSLVPIVGFETLPGLITILPLATSVSSTLSRTSAGTSFGNLYQRAYLKVAPGNYKLWAGVLLSTTGAGSSATVTHGISTLVIGQPIPEQSSWDLGS